MKLLISPSISSSSSATSFDANMCTSKSATASCLAGILRRILCSRSLPTHPSDQTTETSSVLWENRPQGHDKSTDEKGEGTTAATAPGIVATLMGLESLPDAFSVGMPSSSKSITRSRSMNSVEFRGEADQMEGKHKRVRSTLSFREMPTFLEVESEEFFVLSFEDGNESREFGDLKERRGGRCRRSKENRRGKIVLEKKKEDEEEIIEKMVLELPSAEEFSRRFSDKCNQEAENGVRKTQDSSQPLKEDYSEIPNVALQDSKRRNSLRFSEVSHGPKFRKKKKENLCAVTDEEPGSSSEDSSPVSVLDFGQFDIDPEARTSGKDTKTGETSSRRKLSPELDNCSHLSQRSDNNLIGHDQNSGRTEETCHKSRKKGRLSHPHQEYLKTWSEVCKLVEAQVLESNWIHRKYLKSEVFRDITADMEQEILDRLLQELVVDQLAKKKDLNL